MALAPSVASVCADFRPALGAAVVTVAAFSLPSASKIYGQNVNSHTLHKRQHARPFSGYAGFSSVGAPCLKQEANPISIDQTSGICFTSATFTASVAEKEVLSTETNNPSVELQTTQYHFLVANADFMLDEEEHFQEVLRERLRNYNEKNKKQDFWLVIEPKFLDNFPGMANRLKRPAVALVSTDPTWITFMKLRLDRVLKGSYEADTIAAALASNRVNLSFGKQHEWSAPYPKYESGWWTTFLPHEG